MNNTFRNTVFQISVIVPLIDTVSVIQLYCNDGKKYIEHIVTHKNHKLDFHLSFVNEFYKK